MTDADPPSENDSLPPPWLIITGIIVALGVIFVLGFGYGQRWGAPQWGPLAEWIAGAATFAAVVVALRQSNQAQREARRGHLARLVDHEVSRRRECINALGDLWAAIVGMTMHFASFTDYLLNLRESFDPNAIGLDDRPVIYGIGDRIEQFYREWMETIEPPLFVTLALLQGTALYSAVGQINDGMTKIKQEGFPGRLPRYP
jgi:hypothetical protein